MGLAALTLATETEPARPVSVIRRPGTAAASCFALAPVAAGTPPATIDAMPAETRAKALERLRFLELVDQYRRTSGRSADDCCMLVAINHVLEFPLLSAGGKGGKSQLTYANYRNFQRRLQVKKAGHDRESRMLALADDYLRGDRSDCPPGDPEYWKIFWALYLNQNKLPATVAHKHAAAKTRKSNPFATIPTLHQVQYQIAKQPPQAIVLGRHGAEALKNKFIDYIRRDWSEVAAGELIVCDTRTFDTRVRVWDAAKNRWIGVRPNIAGMMDARSWYLASYWITTDPVNHRTLIDTLALYINNAGSAPPMAYMDNGKDYCAAGFSTPIEIDGHEHSIFRELGIGVINSIAYNARAKTIERMFRDLMVDFDKLMVDYLGSRPGQRTDAAAWFDQHPEELPSLEQFVQLFHSWLQSYHTTPKHGEIHQGKSPGEIWDARAKRPCPTVDRLKMALLKPEAIRTVHRGPAVSLGRTEFFAPELWPLMDKKVLVKSDRADGSHVYCYMPDGTLIGEARTRTALKAIHADPEAIAALMADQRRQEKSCYTYINNLTGGWHLTSPIELLLAEADASIETIGSRRLVKGASHEYTRRQVPGTIEAAPEMAVADVEPPEAPFMPPPEQPGELAAFHDFMASRRPADDDYI